MRCLCPHCFQVVVQDKSENGINFCPHCHELFEGIALKKPTWIVGVLAMPVVLLTNWQIMLCHH